MFTKIIAFVVGALFMSFPLSIVRVDQTENRKLSADKTSRKCDLETGKNHFCQVKSVAKTSIHIHT